MANVFTQGFIPSSVTTARTIGTGSTATVAAKYVYLTAFNDDSASRDLTVWCVPNGGTRADRHKLIDTGGRSTLEAKQLATYRFRLHGEDGATIEWQASAANVIAATLSVSEVEDANSDLQFNEGVLLGTTIAQVGSNAVASGRQAFGLGVVLCNFSANVRQVELQCNAGSAADSARLLNDNSELALQAGESRFLQFDHFFAPAGNQIWAKADVANEVACHVAWEQPAIVTT